MNKDERAEKIASLTRKIFDEHREVFEELAKGASPNEGLPEERMDEIMDSLLETRGKLYERLADGPK